jgi:hypothetical protein
VNYLRRKKIIPKISSVIAIAIILRSFIAPGFMISASAEEGLALVFCDGPVSLISQGEDHASGHDHHNTADTDQQAVHISPMCTHWAASSILAVNTNFEPATTLHLSRLEQSSYKLQYVEQRFYHNSYIRGPPQLS